jgi:FSR family fosmidomycin resistance protein-like MFS transporter
MSERGVTIGSVAAPPPPPAALNMPIVAGLSLCHALNDTMQSLLQALYPLLHEVHRLDYAQIGLITLAFQCTASLFQPVVGLVTDRRPMPYSLAVGMASTLCGLLLLAVAQTYPLILLSACLIGLGSAVFHPEASRIARAASGGRYGFAQSFFQVGGNAGTALGPLLAAFIVVPRGQGSVAWFSAAALLGMALLAAIGGWYARQLAAAGGRGRASRGAAAPPLPRKMVVRAMVVLVLLVASKTVYMAALGSFFPLYLIHIFDVSVQGSQLFLFAFLAGVVAGTLAGGAIGDRVGRIPVIWFSILGAAPFTLLLPHVGLWATAVLAALIGAIMASAFSAILVYAQELVPGRVGLVAGLFFGLTFGLGGLGAAGLGVLGDRIGIEAVYRIVAWLPLFGLLAVFLPKEPRRSVG